MFACEACLAVHLVGHATSWADRHLRLFSVMAERHEAAAAARYSGRRTPKESALIANGAMISQASTVQGQPHRLHRPHRLYRLHRLPDAQSLHPHVNGCDGLRRPAASPGRSSGCPSSAAPCPWPCSRTRIHACPNSGARRRRRTHTCTGTRASRSSCCTSSTGSC